MVVRYSDIVNTSNSTGMDRIMEGGNWRRNQIYKLFRRAAFVNKVPVHEIIREFIYAEHNKFTLRELGSLLMYIDRDAGIMMGCYLYIRLQDTIKLYYTVSDNFYVDVFGAHDSDPMMHGVGVDLEIVMGLNLGSTRKLKYEFE